MKLDEIMPIKGLFDTDEEENNTENTASEEITDENQNGDLDSEYTQQTELPREYQKNQTRLSTIIAYLIGVPWEKCRMYYEDNERLFFELDEKESCRVIRALCCVRSNLMLRFNETTRLMNYDLKNLDRIDFYAEDIKTLRECSIDIIRVNFTVNKYIALINKLLSEKIGEIRDIIPEWIRWEYFKGLFVYPKNQNEKNIVAESKKFNYYRGYYPYTKYIHWNPTDSGNILISDSKIAKIIYQQYGEEFTDYSKVKDAKQSVVKSIYDFIDDSDSIQLVVDCENSDAFKLASVLKQLDESEIEKIDRIVLYDDVHTTNAWSYLDKLTDVPIDHNEIERIKENKSLVDIKMGMGISKAFYKEGITSFILLSSDSDFWGVISSLPDAEFLVMAERTKCGVDLQNKLESDGTFYCFIDDFCSGNIRHFKNAMLRTALEKETASLLRLDTKKLLTDIFHNLRMDATPAEMQNFYESVIKKIKVGIDKDGIMTLKVPEVY